MTSAQDRLQQMSFCGLYEGFGAPVSATDDLILIKTSNKLFVATKFMA